MRARSVLRILFAVMLVAFWADTPSFAQGALVNGANHAASIGSPLEIDSWTFNANQGQALVLRVGETLRTPDSGFWPWIRLYGPAGNLLASQYGSNAAEIWLSAPLAGSYRVDVASNDSGNDALGDYVLRLALGGSAFSTSPGDEGGPLTNGGNNVGRIEPADLDLWSFSAGQNESIILRIGETLVDPSNPDPGFWPWIRVFGPQGDLVSSQYGANAAESWFAAPLAGTYTVIVASNDSGYFAAGDYTLRLARMPGPYTVASGDEGGPLTNGSNHTGHIALGDLDTWTFTAGQGESILLRIGEALVGPGVPDPGFWPWIRLFNPLGAQVSSQYGSDAAEIWATAALAGTYTVVVASNDSGYDSIGDYTLRLARMPGPYTVADGDEGGGLTNGGDHSGRISLADLDTWTFAAGQGDSVVLRIGEVLVGPGTPDPGFWPWIRLFDPLGALVRSEYGSNAAEIWVTAPLAGTYTVVVASNDSGYDAEGDYLLRMARMPGSFVVPPGDTGGTMNNSVDYAGRTTLGDLDQWAFSACQGSSVTLTLAEVPVGPSVPDPGYWPWFRVYDPLGTYVSGNYGDTGAQLSFTPSRSGSYTAVVASNDSGYDASGDYVIRVAGACAPPPPPTTVNDAYSTSQNTALTVTAPGVLANDTGAVTASLASSVATGTGTVSLNANGSFTYTPLTGFTGVATFTYRAVNAAGPGNVATVTITVTSGPTPTAVNDTFTGERDRTLTIGAPGVLLNDNPNGAGALSASLVSPTSHGGINLSGSGGFTYTPNSGFTGSDSFTYRATAGNGTSSVATVTLTVTAPTTTVQAPTALLARVVNGNSVTLTWTPPTAGPAPTSYIMEGGVTPGQVLAAIPTGSAAPVFTFGAPNGAFYLRVKAVAGGQTSAASNEIRVFVNQPVPPSAPTGLAGLVNGQQVALSWRNTFGGGTPSAVILDVSGTLSASLPLGLTDSFTFNGVPGGTYTFSVRAVNPSGSSPSSNPVTLTFPGSCSGAPSAPENFLTYNVGNTLHLLWDPAASGAATTGFVLNVSGAFTGTFPLPTRGLSAAVPPGAYTFTLTAANACGASTPTAAQTVVVP